MPTRLASLLLLGALATTAIAAEPSRLAPIPKEEAASTHGPYEMGACETCHQRHDAQDPGSALKVSNDLCFECHDEFRGKARVRLESATHPAVKTSCTACHNPHNSRKKKLRL
jgi:predicted CXXCH cytochrome family protein